MFFIGGISSGVKPLEYLKTVICGRCGAYGRYQVYMTYMYFSFFFIPIFKWNRRFFVEMSCCGLRAGSGGGKETASGRGGRDHGTRSDTSAGWKWKPVDGK